jgi:23S rRNA pseudouridine2605 synthase
VVDKSGGAKPHMRIQRALARSGVASRRHAEELVASGRVTVNGEIARIGQSVDPVRDAIVVDGVRIAAPATAAEATWIVLNKPSGVMTTRRDPEGRRTVFDLVPDHPGLTYVGRLDLLTEGVLLLTTDGEAAHKLTHPSSEVERTYVAHVRGDADAAAAEAMEHGVELDDGLVIPRRADARPLGRGRWLFQVTLAEGRNREVRRLCEALGLTVDRLVRTKFGPIELGELEAGRGRPLTSRERMALDRMLGRPHVRPPMSSERNSSRSRASGRGSQRAPTRKTAADRSERTAKKHGKGKQRRTPGT